MKTVEMVAFWLVVVGAVNWGLAALGFNVVDMLLGVDSMLAKVVYLLVGASGVYVALTKGGK